MMGFTKEQLNRVYKNFHNGECELAKNMPFSALAMTANALIEKLGRKEFYRQIEETE